MRTLFLNALTLMLTVCFTVASDSAQGKLTTGKLIVTVISGDLENTPADYANVFVHGHPFSSQHDIDVVLKQVKPGRYEADLASGLYDIFVSAGDSYPRCKRVQIDPGREEYWLLKLEIDDEHLAR